MHSVLETVPSTRRAVPRDVHEEESRCSGGKVTRPSYGAALEVARRQNAPAYLFESALLVHM